MSNIVVIDYGSGNLRSAAKALEHVSDVPVLVSSDAQDVLDASHIVLPGQGAFGDCMNGLKALDGMVDALNQCVLQDKIPFLGICVGMQLMVQKGLEHGEHDGLGWIEGSVVPIPNDKGDLKIPHMGWNDLTPCSTEFSDFKGKDYYFVHSFMVECRNSDHVLATTHYGTEITAVIGRDNMVGMQFHPEKSHNNGLELLKKFVNRGQ